MRTGARIPAAPPDIGLLDGRIVLESPYRARARVMPPSLNDAQRLAGCFRCECSPLVAVEIAAAWFERYGTDAHWAGLAKRAGVTTPDAATRAETLALLSEAP